MKQPPASLIRDARFADCPPMNRAISATRNVAQIFNLSGQRLPRALLRSRIRVRTSTPAPAILLGNPPPLRHVISMKPLLDHATILITGASAGLGAEFARQLAPRARCLILAARRADRLAALAKEIARDGLTIHCLTVDVGDPVDTTRFLADLQALNDAPSVVINNAGLGDHGLFEDSDWSRIKGMIDVNITGLTRITHALVKSLIKQGRGAILNVSSIASLLPVPQMAVYSATKAYVTSFTEALRCELRGTGIEVLALCPGPVDTEFFTIAERPNSDQGQAAPEIMKIPAAQVVREGLAALQAGRARVIPGWFVWAVMTAAVCTPMFITRFFLNRRGRNYKGH